MSETPIGEHFITKCPRMEQNKGQMAQFDKKVQVYLKTIPATEKRYLGYFLLKMVVHRAFNRYEFLKSKWLCQIRSDIELYRPVTRDIAFPIWPRYYVM